MAFGFGTGYCGLHAIFSFFLKELPGSNIIVNIIRIVMSVLQVAFLTSSILFICSTTIREQNIKHTDTAIYKSTNRSITILRIMSYFKVETDIMSSISMSPIDEMRKCMSRPSKWTLLYLYR